MQCMDAPESTVYLLVHLCFLVLYDVDRGRSLLIQNVCGIFFDVCDMGHGMGLDGVNHGNGSLDVAMNVINIGNLHNEQTRFVTSLIMAPV